MIGIKLVDGNGTQKLASVNVDGVLAVGNLKPTESENQQLNLANTAFNFVKVKSKEKFVLTGVIINADRFVSANGADVVIYAANTADSITPLKIIFELDILRNQTIPILGSGQFEIGSGLFLNAKTTSGNINVTMLGYFLPATDPGGIEAL